MWPVWRIWMQGKEHLHVIMDEWSYVELMEANAIMDMQDAMEAATFFLDEQEMKAASGAGKGRG